MKRARQGGKDIAGKRWFVASSLCALLAVSFLTGGAASAREAAFLDPGAGSAGASDEAVRVEPKGDIDIGDSILGVARRVDLFFVNQAGAPVKIEKIAINGDGNVATEIVNDDCSKQGSIAPGSRCNVGVSITPSSPGPWSAEVLLTHNGAGRIARAKLSGKTGGATAAEKKDMGLSLSTKEVSPVNFGDVNIDGGKVVRSALMVNDSAEPITIYSIDVIEAANGLQRLDQGCAVDMELKPGESCPVTLVWTPADPGQVSTDLIIRHSGRMGFAVIPIRGSAKGMVSTDGKSGSQASGNSSNNGGKNNSLPPPPSAKDLEKATNGKIAPLSAAALGTASGATVATSVPEGKLTLIGTVGQRAVLVKPDGKTTVVSAGDEIDLGEKTVKVMQVDTKSTDILMDGKKKTLFLEASPELIAKASSLSKGKEKAGAKSQSDSDNNAPENNTPIPAVEASGAPSGGLMSTPSGASR